MTTIVRIFLGQLLIPMTTQFVLVFLINTFGQNKNWAALESAGKTLIVMGQFLQMIHVGVKLITNGI